MAENQVKSATTGAKKTKLTGEALAAHRALRRGLKTKGRNKRKLKLKTDAEYAKTVFAGRSKRSNDKKVTFRKKKARKK